MVQLVQPDAAVTVSLLDGLAVEIAARFASVNAGDGGHEELSGAEQAGVRPFRAIWFLRRWPHFRAEPGAIENIATVGDIVSLVERTMALPDGP